MDLLLKRVSDKQTDKLIRLKKVIEKKENLKFPDLDNGKKRLYL